MESSRKAGIPQTGILRFYRKREGPCTRQGTVRKKGTEKDMEELRKLFYEFERITDSYRGSRTDWKEKCDCLENLVSRISALKIRDCKYSRFYAWTREKLREEVREEFIRVWKLAAGKEADSR